MVELMNAPQPGALGVLLQKFRNLGLDREEDQRALAGLVKRERRVGRGQDITGLASRQNMTVLLTGVACACRRREDGSRSILTFMYAGDLCGSHRDGLR